MTIKMMLVLCAIISFLSACNYNDFAVYNSSEGSNLALIVDRKTGHFRFNDNLNWIKGYYNKECDLNLHITAKDGFYDTDLYLAIPMNRLANRWGDKEIDCFAQAITKNSDVKMVQCKYIKIGRESYFKYNIKRGITEFKMGCVDDFDKICTYKLLGGDGILSESSVKAFSKITGQYPQIVNIDKGVRPCLE